MYVYTHTQHSVRATDLHITCTDLRHMVTATYIPTSLHETLAAHTCLHIVLCTQ